jgi:hypothetical protein
VTIVYNFQNCWKFLWLAVFKGINGACVSLHSPQEGNRCNLWNTGICLTTDREEEPLAQHFQ